MSVDNDAPPSLDSTIGVELIGFSLALALYGVTTGQAVAYIRTYSRPPLPPCIYFEVLGIVVSYAMAEFLVVQRGNLISLVRAPWIIGAIIIITEINGMLVRMGYAYRIWRLSGRKPAIPCIIAVFSVFVFGVGLAYSAIEVHLILWVDGRSLDWTLYASFSCQIVVDSLIGVSVFLILRRFRTGLRRLDYVIRTLSMYVVNTGLLTTVVVFLCILFFVIRRTSAIYVGLYIPLSKFYTCSFLGVLTGEQLLISHAASSPGDVALPVLSTAMRIGPSAMVWEEDRSMAGAHDEAIPS
ncbi:hypothetical protein C8Q78DRAFT_1149615 [Trametes maxima]|nr:hypothetical protein C8Q78DRAFT_1149615 [Trametes maxima]